MKTEISETGISVMCGPFRSPLISTNTCFFWIDLFSGGNNEGFKGYFEIGSRTMF